MAYQTFAEDDTEVRLDYAALGYLDLTVAGVRRTVHADELLGALGAGNPMDLDEIAARTGLEVADLPDRMAIRPTEDGGVAIEVRHVGVGVPGAEAKLDDNEVALLCEWLSELTELDWEDEG